MIFQSLFLVAAALLVMSGAAPAAAQAPGSTSHTAAARTHALQVRVENAWIPQPPPGAEVAAAYFTLRNAGDQPAVLVAIDCPRAAAAMLHRTTVVSGESRMRPVDSLTIPPRQSVALEPGGVHVMLHELAGPLAVGQSVPLILHFADGKDLQIEAKVRPLGGR